MIMSIFSHIKQVIPEKLKRTLILAINSRKGSRWEQIAQEDKRKAYVFLAGFYQNLGDMAITYAQIQFIKNALPEIQIVAVPANETYSAVKAIKHCIKSDDIITLIGGGNMSDMYQSLEDARLHVVRSFPNNRIISFPQTIMFTSEKSLQRSRKVYTAHKNLTIFAREPASFERARKYFPMIDVRLCPDIVLSLNEISEQKRGKKVLVCMRKDNERIVTDITWKNIETTLIESGYELDYKDTIDVSLSECKEENYIHTLHSYLDRIKSCSFVVTDRLHCMIFCVITGTSCIAFDNSNNKISGVYYQWLRNIPNVTFLRINELERFISTCHELEKIKCSGLCLKDSFVNLESVLR